MGALISDCGKYRYWLSRPAEVMHPGASTALFVMLNPSTADAELDDPTIRRCRGFARSWDCAGIKVANLYALRANDPKQLWVAADPVGEFNDMHLGNLLSEYCEVVCAWGANAKPDRVKQFVQIADQCGAKLWCFGATKERE